MLPCWARLRGWRLSLLSGLFLSISFISIFIVILVYGVNSDLDNIHPSIVRLLPAGHSICKSSPIFESETCLDLVEKKLEESSESQKLQNWQYQYGRDDKNEGLDEEQCILAFPGLFEDVHRAVTHRKDNPITSGDLDNMKLYPGMARAMIFNGEVRTYAPVSLVTPENLQESALCHCSKLHGQRPPEKDYRHSFIYTSVDFQLSEFS